MYSARRLRIFIIIGLLLGLCQPTSAESGKPGTSFLKHGVGARALGMGGAFVGLADDSIALYWNPAGTSLLDQKEVFLAQDSLSQDINQTFLGLVYPSKGRSMGLALNYMRVGGIEGREDEDSPASDLEASFLSLILNYSRKVGSNLKVGVNGKVIRDNLEGDKETGFAFDLGLLYFYGNLGLGLNLNNFGLTLGKDEIPREIKAGLSYRLFNNRLILGVSGWKGHLQLGTEYWFFNKFAMRAGFENNEDRDKLGKNTGFSLGLGAKFSRNYRLDYAWLPYGDLGNTHHLSMGANFGSQTPDLSIEDIQIGNIFPSKREHYTNNPIGRLILKNNTPEDFSNVKVQINIPEFMNLPGDIEVGEILARQSKEVLLKVTLDSARLLEIDENTSAQAEIKAIYYEEGKQKETPLTESVVFLDRNAIDWDNPASVAAFVTSKDKVVKSFTREVLGSVRIEETALPIRVLQAAAIFEALGLLPLKYISDPASYSRGKVFDYVQYPSETLENKSGDCDDFAVLYASLLESIGIRTKLANTTNHLFLLFDCGITKKNSYLVSLREEDFVLIEDRIFIPVETTRVDASFMEAWVTGVREYERWQFTPEEIGLIDLHSAWQIYPPMDLPVKEREIKIPEADRLLARLTEDDEEFKAKQESDYSQVLSELEQGPATFDSYNRTGILHAYMRRHEQAKKAFLEGLAQDVTSAALYNNLGNIYLLEEDFTEARWNYKMALSHQENEPGILLNLGLVSFLEEDDEKALEHFEQVAVLSSLDEIYHKLGLSVAKEELQAPDAKERLIGKIRRLLKIAVERAEGLPRVPEGLKGAEESVDFLTLLYWKE